MRKEMLAVGLCAGTIWGCGSGESKPITETQGPKTPEPKIERVVHISPDQMAAEIDIKHTVEGFTDKIDDTFVLQCIGKTAFVTHEPYSDVGDQRPVPVPGDICADGIIRMSEITPGQ